MKVLMNTLGRFLAKRGRGARSRATLLSLLVALSALAPSGAWGYRGLGMDRILLMNNDKNSNCPVTCQGYADTNVVDSVGKTNAYWWVRSTESADSASLLPGTNHVFHAADGRQLWRLIDCRVGSPAELVKPNYIPASSTAQKSFWVKATKKKTMTNDTATTTCAVMVNRLGAQIYSPYYEEGLGTLYFDAVNVFSSSRTNFVLGVEFGTNVTVEATERGVTLETADSPDDVAWSPLGVDLMVVSNSVLTEVQKDVSDIELSVPGGSGSKMFYRGKSCLNYRKPCRFRFVRRTVDPTPNKPVDSIGLIAVDNVIASKPACSVDIGLLGHYDDSLTGSEVLGRVGDFTRPFLNFNGQDAYAMASYSMLTNSGYRKKQEIKNLKLHYRWRYLNQSETEWRALDFDGLPLKEKDDEFALSKTLKTSDSPDLSDGVGDLEYFFTAEIDLPYYEPIDYAFTATTAVGFGKDWTEKISVVTNRANYVDETPACGHDYFVRIREAESPYEWVKLCTSVTTNHTAGVTREDVRMELVSTNTWRYCYYVPTNAVGETLRFHFEGRKLAASPTDPFTYVASTNIWKADLTELPYLPYTSVAGESFSHDVAVKLDDASTHLVIEFNDDLLAFNVAHGTHQNFNTWTDALVGYCGNASYNEENPTNGASATGVSDAKRKYTADMSTWAVQGYSDPGWVENFNTSDDITYPLYTSFNSATTPQNGFSAAHGQWVRGARGSATVAVAAEEVSLQLEGRGQGYVALDKNSGMPKGIGTVSFAARVAQAPSFNDFATYLGGNMLSDYAISAKVTMSRQRTSDLNPTDISPAQPSLSFVTRYLATKGCYEFRITRSASDQLTCGLYKWRPSSSGMTATLLASNVITSVNNGSYAKPGPGQQQISNFQNMLVPTGSDDVNYAWTSAYMFVFNTSENEVAIRCVLSNSRNNRSLSVEDRANHKTVITYEDSDRPFLKGTYGVGSTDCNAAFGAIMLHDPADADNVDAGINYAGTAQLSSINGDEWAFFPDRWRQIKSSESTWGASGALGATMPTNQTIRLQFKDDDNGWFDSGYEVPVSSFSTNHYEFAPCVSPDYKVRLITGGNTYDEVRTDVTVDDVEITAWRAGEIDNLEDDYGKAENWVYTAGTVESAFEMLSGPGVPEVNEAGTNGFYFAFSEPGVYQIVPQMDMEVDRILLVGGGGAGGWTLGGGGGGGGVREPDLGTNAVLLAKGKTVIITVGGGGDNYFVNNNDWKYWKAGGNGGASSIIFTDSRTGKAYNESVKGGGGGAGWNNRNGTSGQATGGGAAQGDDNAYYSSRASGTSGQGSSGGRAYGDRAGGGGGAALDETGLGEDGTAEKDGAGDGGDGRASDITGSVVYYGGGGGGGGGNGSHTPDSAAGGAGGKGGGGTGLDAAAQTRSTNLDGTDGLGGGGGGGSHAGAAGTSAGGKGGSGVVILRTRTASKVCTLQPARGTDDTAMGLRSPYLGEGMSMFSFNYANANSNCVLLLQVCLGTNTANGVKGTCRGLTSMSATKTREPPVTDGDGGANWVTLTNFTFTGMSAKELASGTKSHYMSLRAPLLGFLRLVMSPEVIARSLANEGPERDVTDGMITITKISCYNEPKLDMRSWWGWNLHTEGWNTDDKQYAYLFDSPEGLSASLNFSSKAADSRTADARGIELAQPDLEDEYAKDNSFVQCPPLTNGIGTVTFRARTFTTNQTLSSYVTLYGSAEPDTYQPEVPEAWQKLATFEITNTTYQTFKWSTTDDNTKVAAVRLEVAASRHGRQPGPTTYKSWEVPPVIPIQRVWVDEITASEPVVPRLLFRDVRPFRSHIGDLPASTVTNVTDLSEQPILGECWGIQATVEPQQMSDELDESSVVVYAAFYRGIKPWGYSKWKDDPSAITVQLEKVASNLVFRSTYNNASSVIGPDMTPNGVFPNNVWQYTVWAEYLDKQGVSHKHMLEATEWAPPSWYYGIDDFNVKYGTGDDTFVGYTFLDSISPSRAWINEVNICDTDTNDDYTRQYVELAVPQGADIEGWRIDLLDRNLNRGTIAWFGSGNAKVTSKNGTKMGVDATNHYTFVALRSPGALEAGTVANADGTWLKTAIDSATATNITGLSTFNGNLRYYLPYGLALVRPSGVIEHQIVFEGTNIYYNTVDETRYSGTNLLRNVKLVDGDDSHWFYAGGDSDDGSLGVFRSHGEDQTCWTNWMVQTPVALNQLRDGTLQDIAADWFLQPNGTNVWIYATVLGEHISQRIGSNTNRTSVTIVRKGTSTNIVYTTAPWYQIGVLQTNGVTVTEAQGRAKRSDTPSHQWTFKLENVEETVNVTVDEEPAQDVLDAGLSRSDPYYNAVMLWLASFGSDAPICRAAQLDLADTVVGELDIRDMYWLDINPMEEGWALKAGMGGVAATTTSARSGGSSGGASLAAVAPVPYENEAVTNVRVLVTMMITNRNTGVAYAPNHLQGLEPGSNSADYGLNSANWTSVTFKVCGALQREGVKNDFYPLRWFVFGPDSFDANFQSRIEISDPHATSSPGYFNGWSAYPDVPVFYKWKLDAEPPTLDTTEMLKADSTYH